MSKQSTVRDIKDKTPNEDLVSILESLLADAKAGNIRTMVALYGWDDDAWTHGWAIDNRNTKRRLLGELSMLHFDIMTNMAFDDGDTVLSRAFDCE